MPMQLGRKDKANRLYEQLCGGATQGNLVPASVPTAASIPVDNNNDGGESTNSFKQDIAIDQFLKSVYADRGNKEEADLDSDSDKNTEDNESSGGDRRAAINRAKKQT
jgi:hypothetical protein